MYGCDVLACKATFHTLDHVPHHWTRPALIGAQLMTQRALRCMQQQTFRHTEENGYPFCCAFPYMAATCTGYLEPQYWPIPRPACRPKCCSPLLAHPSHHSGAHVETIAASADGSQWIKLAIHTPISRGLKAYVGATDANAECRCQTPCDTPAARLFVARSNRCHTSGADPQPKR